MNAMRHHPVTMDPQVVGSVVVENVTEPTP